MPCASGHCVLTSVGGVQNLVHYFQLTSCNQNVYIPFELKGVRCNKRVDLSTERLFVQGKSKTDLKEKERIRKRNYRNKLRHNESSQEKKSRLAQDCEYKRAQRQNESSEQREK